MQGTLIAMALSLAVNLVLCDASSTNIIVMVDDQESTNKYVRVGDDGRSYIQNQNIYAKQSLQITQSESQQDQFDLVLENVLIQVAVNVGGTITMDLPNASIFIKKSTIKSNTIKIKSEDIKLDLAAIEYNRLTMIATNQMTLNRSETYHSREYCSTYTTKFIIDRFFSFDPQCEDFRPFDLIMNTTDGKDILPDGQYVDYG